MQWNEEYNVNTEVSQSNSGFVPFQLQEQALYQSAE